MIALLFCNSSLIIILISESDNTVIDIIDYCKRFNSDIVDFSEKLSAGLEAFFDYDTDALYGCTCLLAKVVERKSGFAVCKEIINDEYFVIR